MSKAAPLVAAAGERLARVIELGAAVGQRRATRAATEAGEPAG
jgi:hypothetical protein